MIDYDNLGELAVSSAIIETKLREGRYKTIDELSSLYKSYMELRFDMLKPKNVAFHAGSLKAYDCTLELIIGIMSSLTNLNADEKNKTSLKKTLQEDYEKVKQLKENFRKRLEVYT